MDEGLDALPELEPEVEPDEAENLGAGAPLPFALPDEEAPDGVPEGLYVVPLGAPEGTGIANGLFGAVAILGAEGFETPLDEGAIEGFKLAFGALAIEGLTGAGF